MTRDADGHRTYKIKHLVGGPSNNGPALALQTSGLPTVGSYWSFGADVDVYAYCKQDATVTPVLSDGDLNEFFEVEQTFTTKGDEKFCKDEQFEDPLTEPQKVSGGFQKFMAEGLFDRFGHRILNSAWEQIRGPQNEWDESRPSVKIEQNVAVLQYDMVSQMVDTVNGNTLWGFPPRTIKLSNFTWEKKFYGTCYYYYTRTFEFDIFYRRRAGVDASGTSTSDAVYTGDYDDWDREIGDEGTKVLSGHWSPTTGAWVLDNVGGAAPDPGNPAHFQRFQDRKGNTGRVLLNGYGLPIDTTIGTGTGTFTTEDIGSILVEKYGESEFLLLGIPTSF